MGDLQQSCLFRPNTTSVVAKHTLVRNGTFRRRVVGWWFADWHALDQENRRIWETYYQPKPAYEHIADWQAWLPEHRQVIVEVQAIAEETGWRGPVRTGNTACWTREMTERPSRC